ncbi:MAG: hydrogenase maturation protease [Candidatus Zixiibacteriota bacterium]|nr:MAG: hydrogenase maturation protease [candidate division Zixibacteria bacterium]
MSILVIGIGNEYRSDDAVGLEIADSLSEYALENCAIKRTSGEGIALMNLWEDFAHVILIDAVLSGCEAGTIHKIDLSKETLQADWFQTSSHLFALPEAVQLAKTLNKLPKTILAYGIEGKNFDYGVGLSPKVQEAKKLLANRIKADIKALQQVE